MLDFLSAGRQKHCWVSLLCAGAPQGFVLSHMLITLMTDYCFARSTKNHIVKFLGFIKDSYDPAHREEVEELTCWDRDNVILNAARRNFILNCSNGDGQLL